ncbi:MAG: LytTR family DNA-binding domain-containing protein [Bacteroidia bacterium]|nr:LytTR family DNA-binding domain-containing protein [Bacteroidia bacterium]
MQIRCLIVDDEPLAREGLAGYVAEVEFLQLAGSCENALRANDALAAGPVDLLFLDIHMPRMTGLEFIRSLAQPPLVIITTAYPHFALEGYELDVLDYLVKPISFDRFLKSANKARDYLQLARRPAAAAPVPDYVFVKCGNRYERIALDELIWVEAMQNYVILHTRTHKHIVYLTLSGIQQQLPADRFIRIHKSCLVALDQVTAVEGNTVFLSSGKGLTVGREYRQTVQEGLLGGRLLRR